MIDSIKNIKLSLMKRDTDIKEGKASYNSYISASFNITEKIDEDFIKSLLPAMLDDLNEKCPFSDADSIGIWIKTDNGTVENAISLQTLYDIKQYSKVPIS